MINLLHKKEGRIQKISFALIFFLIIFSLTAIFLTAQDETDLQNSISEETTSAENANDLNEISPESTNEEESTLEEPTDEENVSSLETDSETQDETFPESNLSDGTSQILEENLENETTILNSNEEPSEIEIEKPKLDIQISSPSKITRGENILLLVNITNIGNVEAKRVFLEFSLPEGFEEIKEEIIGTISPGEFVTKEIEFQTDISNQLGINEIKIFINYNEI